MLRFILKISLILVFANIFAEEPVDTAINIDPKTVESVLNNNNVPDELNEIIEGVSVEKNLLEENKPEVSEADILYDDTFAEEDAILIKNVMLVLDNSGSMKKNDPALLVSKAVREFIAQQDENTRVGIVIFDQDVRLPVSLTNASLANREIILNSIEEINYKGLFTDSPAGIERAIYELKNNALADTRKLIIFMTDGIVDTGVPERDLEKSRWLREDLAEDAADNEIKIFGIAFTDQADFQLIQSIAQKTGGEYYRALRAKDLQGVFERINKIINKPPEPALVTAPIKITPTPVIETPAPIALAPAPVIIEVPTQAKMGQEERIRSIIIIAVAIILTIILLGILLLMLRRNREFKVGAAVAQEAYINDLQGKTDKQTHKLGTKPIMLGRIAGKDTDHLDYIVVNESTIGRRHSLIDFKDYSYWIVDQGSINGTFVNGQPVSTEVRLKHGDRIRLNKCEFEFIMPEMEDSGKTIISNTVFAAQPSISEEATVMSDHDANTDNDSGAAQRNTAANAGFDFTGTDSSDRLSGSDGVNTITRKFSASDVKIEEPYFSLDDNTKSSDSEDETIMLDDEDVTARKDD